MLNYEDFKTPDGRIDFDALRAAEIAAGERCSTCETLLPFNFDKKTGPTQCYHCRALETETRECQHTARIRCPHCGHIRNVTDEDYQLCKWGEHSLTCAACQKSFTVETRITYHFTSPQRTEGAE